MLSDTQKCDDLDENQLITNTEMFL